MIWGLIIIPALQVKYIYKFALIDRLQDIPCIAHGKFPLDLMYDAPCLTKITLDNWRCFGQVEVLSTAGGTLDNWRCYR